MGNLSNLYVSKSFQSLIHLGTDNVATPSLTTLQDGYGNSIGIEVNTAGDLFLSGSLTASLQQGYVWVGNASGKTTTVSTSSFGGGGGTIPAGTISSSAQITALGFVSSSITASSLITASFNNGTRNLTFTKGDNSTFSVNIPDVSGSAGNFVTTSSFNSYTASTDSSISQLNASSASQQVSINNLNTTTASLLVETQNLEAFSASALVSISNLNASSASQQVSINSLNSATSSLFTSASLALTTASVSGTTMTFTKGNGTTFNVTLPTGSGGGGTINTGSFATTGSNSFNGDQNVTGSIRYSQQLQVGTANLGPTIQSLPSGTPLGDTGLQVNAGESGSFSMRTLYGGQIAQATLEAYNTFPSFNTGGKIFAKSAGGVTLNGFGGNIELSGSNTTIQGLRYPNTDGTNGQVLTTNGSGVLTFTTVSGGSINTGSFATTGSNTFVGNQTITGSIQSITNTNGVNGQYFGTTFGGNIGLYNVSNLTEIGLALDGASWTTNWANGPLLYVNNTPGDTYEGVFGFQNKTNYTDGRVTVLKPLDVIGNTTITGSLILSSSAAVELRVIGDSVFTGSTSITGALSITPVIAPNGAPGGIGQFIIPFLSGSNNVFARDQDNALYWQPAFNVLAVSASTGNTTMGVAGMSVNSSTTGSSTLTTTRIASNFGAGRNIAIAGDAAGTALTGLTGITNPAIILQSGSVGLPSYYAPIQFESSQSFTDGRVTVTRPLVVSGSLFIQSGSALPVSTGSAILTWNASTGRVTQAPFSSIISASVSSGEFWSTTTQSGSAGVSGSIQFNNSGSFYNTSIVNGTQLQVANGGVYNIQFSAQIETSAGADTLWIWFKKNGNNIGASASKAVLANNTAQIMTVNILDEAAANDYYEIAYQNLNGHATVLSEAASGNIPAIPSVIATIFQIR